jgi:DNA repair protein RadA/Sms
MAKVKSIWICNECGTKSTKWIGQCGGCEQWNTLHEEMEFPEEKKRYSTQGGTPRPPAKAVKLRDISVVDVARYLSGVGEFDRLTGGGVVPGSLSLIGGDPGIGKSTLLLQMSNRFAHQGLLVLYVCGEESVEQTSLRARRLGIDSERLLLLSETSFSAIQRQIEEVKPDVVIIDSIQIIYKDEIASAPGSVTQVRECTASLMHMAKGETITIFLVGHVTKAGEIAGPRVLEHLVDTVLYFEGDKQHNFRMLRVVKNRFGPTDEIAVFQMTERGLAEVPNPSKLFLEERMRHVVGSVIIPTIEGTRPILVEAQALVTDTSFSTPARKSAGLDGNRLALLLAVLEKRAKFPLYTNDVFVSIAGGMRISEPAVDLGILLAIASSKKNQQIDPNTVVVGEVGLAGEVRSVPRIEARIKESIHLGFERAIIPKKNYRGIPKEYAEKIKLIGVEFIEEAIDAGLC